MKRICVVAHNAFGAMTGRDTGHVGGVERQTSMICRHLAVRGYSTSLVTWDEGQADGIDVDGVRVIKMCRRDAGLPGIRFFHPRWTGLRRALEKADAEVYYQNCAEYVTGQVALWCRHRRRRFVYSVASEPACDPRLPEMPRVRERVLYRYGIRHADRVIVQTKKQRGMLWEGFGLHSVVLPMPCIGPSDEEYRDPRAPFPGDTRIVWVGRIARVKRLELLLDVAARLPDISFDVVGAPNIANSYASDVLSRARGIPNVTLHGRVPWERMHGMYRRASLLCCTSTHEGFPNAFLEAWSNGLPVVTTFDPDGIVASAGMGVVAKDGEGLAAGIRGLTLIPEQWREASGNARRYFIENHALGPAMSRFERLFLEVMAEDGGMRRK